MTQHDNILIVPVPEGSRNIELQDNVIQYVVSERLSDIVEHKIKTVDLPPGPWRIVGRALELTEEQWLEVVPVLPSGIRWANYEHPERLLLSATESGMSLLRSHGIDPESNPLILINEKEGV